jgi:hypothetical protein
MTGDDHGNGGTAGRFDAYKAASPAGCSVPAWECVRSSSYVYPGTPLTDAQASSYTAEGFEVGLHVNTGCADWTPGSLESFYSDQLASWSSQFSSIPSPSSNRTHCIAWSDYATQPKIELNHGIRLDTNYYYWPPSWVQDRPGLFTGSAMPQRFADLDGTTIDVYQAATQMTDESGQSYPFTINTLLDRALGPQAYYGVFTANMHTDSASSAGSDAIVASAQSRGVPIVSGRQMLTWLDGRNGSSFSSISRSGGTLTFTITVGSGANGLRGMLPTKSADGTLTSIERAGNAVPFSTQTIKGIEYAFFDAVAGSYTATYAADTTPPTVTSVSPANGATGVATASTVSATFSEPMDASTIDGSRFQLRDPANNLVPASVSYDAGSQTATLAPTSALANSTVYTATVKGGSGGVTDSAGNPLAADYSWSFTTAAAASASLGDTSVADFSAGTPDANTYIAQTGDGELILKPSEGAEFFGSSLPSGWFGTAWSAGGGASVGGGTLTVDGARAGTNALYGPGRSLEFVATFAAAAPSQHVGFGTDYNNPPWAIFSTRGGDGLYARTNNGSAPPTDTLLSSSYLGAPHRFRIDWTATGVVFSIDGAQVASHTVVFADQMRPLASDFQVGGATLPLDWLRMSPYPGSGVFLSRILDAGASVAWGSFAWSGQTPAGTSLALSVRTGNTPTPDGSWSAFTPVTSSGTPVGRSSRYLQYRAELGSSDPDQTPVLEAVSVAYSAAAVTHAVADFDGNGTTDLSVWRPSEGRWYTPVVPFSDWGTSGDVPVPADYDGNGANEFAVWRPSEGRWYIKGGAFSDWGTSGDIPVPADYDGDGKADLAVFRPSEGRWYILRSSDGGLSLSDWGTSGDIPVPADYNGDGKAELAVYRPSEGRWYIKGAASFPDWGTSGDIPVPADYNGDGKADIAVYRPSEGAWYDRDSGTVTSWGTSGDRPEPGDYNGDGTSEIAVFRPSEGRWYINGGAFTDWGLSSDVQLPLPYAIRQVFFP